MAKKIFEETQRFRNLEIFGLLLFFILGLSYRFVERYVLSESQFDVNALGMIGFILLLGGVFIYLWKLTLNITITKKGLQYRYKSLFGKNQKIKWKDIDGIQFIETPVATQLSGWNVQFQNDEEQFSMCGRNGIQIVTKDGRKVFLGSKRLAKLKSKIIKFITKKS